MRSITFLIAGLIAGFFANSFLRAAKDSKVPTETPPPVTAISTAESRSPFTVVKNTADTNAGSTIASAGSIQQPTPADSATTETAYPDLPAGEISHYKELIAALRHIDSANSDQLFALAQQLTKHTIGRADHFKPAINAAIYQRWAIIDIDAALEHISQSIDSPSRSTHFEMEGVHILASIQPDYLQSWLKQLNRSQQSMLQHQVYSGITLQDPEAFARKALQDSDDHPDDMLFGALMQWAEKDPAAAWRFLQTEASPEISGPIFTPVLYSWMERDPQGALSELAILIENSDKSDPEGMMLQEMYATALARTDPNAALQWITSKLDSDLQNYSPSQAQQLQHGLLPNILYHAAEADPVAVEHWLDQLSGTQQQTLLPAALPMLSEILAQQDPLRALEIVEKYSLENDYDHREIIVQQWLYSDREAANEWLTSLPATAANEQLTSGAAMSFLYEDPDMALTLLDRTQTPVTVEAGLGVVAGLAAVDPNTARLWLNKQTDAQLLEAGSLYIDISHNTPGTASTADLLSRIEGLNSPDKQMTFVMQLLNNSTTQDREIISQWISGTSALSDSEREDLQMMLRSPPHGQANASFYTRHNYGASYGSGIQIHGTPIPPRDE